MFAWLLPMQGFQRLPREVPPSSGKCASWHGALPRPLSAPKAPDFQAVRCWFYRTRPLARASNFHNTPSWEAWAHPGEQSGVGMPQAGPEEQQAAA